MAALANRYSFLTLKRNSVKTIFPYKNNNHPHLFNSRGVKPLTVGSCRVRSMEPIWRLRTQELQQNLDVRWPQHSHI